MIRDEPAEYINFALKQNLSIMKLQIDMNPIKLATLKEIELSIKRTVAQYKEKQGPAIKREISSLINERQRVLEDIPNNEKYGKTLLETVVNMD